MSKAVKTDHEMNLNEFIRLLTLARGGRSIRQFATEAGVSPSYISKYLSGVTTTPPTPTSIQKIASVAANNVSIDDLLISAGYNPEIHRDNGYVSISLGIGKTASHLFRGLNELNSAVVPRELQVMETKIIAKILGAFEKKKISATMIEADYLSDFCFSINGGPVDIWRFEIIPPLALDHSRLLQTYLKLAMAKKNISTQKYTVLTFSDDFYNSFKSNAPESLATYISIIKIDETNFDLIKEEYLQTALPISDEMKSFILIH